MKVAIFGQYYQNDTRPIIKDIFDFFNRNDVELVIEKNFLGILYEEKIVEKEYQTFASHADLNSSFDILISIGGDGTILRAATFVRDSGIPILGVNAGRLGFFGQSTERKNRIISADCSGKKIHHFRKNLIDFRLP
jgi:NAD+ kinase